VECDMSSDRIQRVGDRSGLMGWWDRLRYNEILRQGIGLLLVAVCAYLARPGSTLVIIGLAMAAFGQIFRIYAAGFIHKNKRLASTGPYALVRHPLYLGNFLILIGFALAANNLYVWIGVALFFMIWYPAAIAYEDSKLESIFEDEWRAWSKDIRAIIPGKFKWADLKAEGWDTYQSLIRNGELPISLYLGSCGIWLWVVTQQT
jgi:protein-S-isoprenylcysteine O-methyltransferase Ste14